ncbi:MAG TPA: hypothetical protein VNY81_01210 [Candidatus Saccharimonadales bacterium]|nr:hypothetical protein [Candidatus Saccharimonadales bacterium]
MKFQTKIRMQMVIVGLGAALLMAGSARAQQDMDPTYFDVNPGTPAASKVVAVRTAQSSARATENEAAQSALTLASSKESTLEAGVARMAIVDASAVLILFGGVMSIVLYARAATRRERMMVASRVHRPYAPISAATAQ